MKVSKFEDLTCWQAARVLVGMVYKMTSKRPFSRDYGLVNQIQRASISVMANIAEGFASCSKLERIRFLGYSSRSAAEVQSHLYAAMDLGYIEREVFDGTLKQAQTCMFLSKGFIRYLKK